MPSISTYTSLESLLVLQSVARHGADADALTDISQSLISNRFIREDGKYSPGRLQPDALKSLYSTLVEAKRDSTTDKDAGLNGHSGTNGSNPRKRKLSPAPISSSHAPSRDEEKVVTELVDQLYAQYKEQIVKEIRQDEEEYKRLQQEIAKLENDTTRGNLTEVDDTAQERQILGQKLQNVADDTKDGIRVASDDARSETIQIHAETGEGAHGQDARRDGLVGTTLTHAEDPPRMAAETVGRPLQTPLQRQPILSAQGQTDITPRQFPSPSVLNAQRAPPLGHMQSSQSPHNRTLPPPAPYPQHPGYGPIPGQHPYPGPGSPRSPVILPPPPGMTHMSHQRTPSDGGPPRGSPVSLPHSQPYQPYPPYSYSQVPWPQQQHPHPQYPQHHPPYVGQHFYPQPVSGRHPYPSQSPNQSPYAYYPQSAPPNRHLQSAMAGPVMPATSYPRPLQSASAMSTPVTDRVGRQDRPRLSGSSTPWTPKAVITGGPRPGSPVRPDREVSPLSDPGSPSTTPMDEHVAAPASYPKVQKSGQRGPKPIKPATVKSEKLPSGRGSRPARRKRGDSNTSSGMGSESRSQSLASFASEGRRERASTARLVKNEPPSTPAPVPSDSDQQRSSGLRRGRGNTVASQVDVSRSTTKRKRDSTQEEASPSPSLTTPRGAPSRLRPRPEAIDPSMVSVTKNFARMTGALMNDVTTYKYAGIFAKPLSEREAPGYKDLIYRPQDLKSIKTAIGRGSRIANAAVDELAAGEDGAQADTPTKGSGATGTGAGSMTLLKKTDELAPPKGIVNSSQLEMELMRIFANAIMFNPLTAAERGLGPRYKMQRVDGKDAADHETLRDGGDDGSKGYSYVQAEEGGIIADTRDMCEFVEKAVGSWRSAELGLVETAPLRSSTGAGVGGGSMSSVFGDENEGTSDADGTKTDGGTARKRRKIDT